MATEVFTSKAADLWGFQVDTRNAKDRLLLKAMDLFYFNGFNAIGLDRVIAETGVTKTTFYKYFESKDELIVAAIEKRHEWESEALRRAVQRIAGDDPIAQLTGPFDVLDEWFNNPAFNGCIFINAAGEFPNPSDPAHKAAAAHKHKHRAAVLDLANKAALRDPGTFVDSYMTLFEGMMVVRHIHGRNDAARTTKSIVEKLLAQHR